MRQTTKTLFGRAKTISKTIFRRNLLFGTLCSSFVLSGLMTSAQPKWVTSYPSIINGASSADISVQLSEPGTVYYAVYNTAPTGVTASKIKTDAAATLGGSIVRNGRISVAQANTLATTYLTGMPENKTYYFCMVAEGTTSGLQPDADAKNISKIFPLRQTSNSFRAKLGPNALVGYLAYVPEAYYKDPSAKFPVLLMLHGMGEKLWNPQNISQLNLVRKYGPAMLIDKGQEFPFIVITPQCPFPGWDDVSTDGYKTTSMQPGKFVNEIYDYIEANYRIDKSREYLTGISMGGGSVWSYLQEPNNRVAAAIPIAGWGDFAKASVVASQNTPIWNFQGGNDGGANMQSLINTVNSFKPSVLAKCTVYPGVGHNAWDITYNNSGPGIAPDNIYDWLMRYTKAGKEVQAPNKAPIVDAGENQTIILPTNSTTIRSVCSDTDGSISSYTWTQKSGAPAVISGISTSTLTLSGLTEGQASFLLTVKDDKGVTSKDSVTVTVKPAPVGSSNNGLTAAFYNNITLTGSPVSTSIDPNINFSWGSAAPAGLNVNKFGVRWTGAIEALYSETYTFYTSTDDGVKLWVNGKLLIDTWKDGVLNNSGKIDLEAGVKYEIKMEYYDNCCDAKAILSWSSLSQSKVVVPSSQLFPTYTPDVAESSVPTGTGLAADYFNNLTLSGTPILSTIDPTVDFKWSGSPATGVNSDRFSVRWSGEIKPIYSETYTFYTSSDDGVRLWINDVLVINNWTNHATTTNSGNIDLEAGQLYSIKMEFYDDCCAAEARLSWSSTSQATQIVPKENLFPAIQSYAAAAASAPAITLYPVPASDILNVSFSSGSASNADIKILDDLSQIKLQNTVASQAGSNTVTIDISQITTGVYTLVVTTSDRTLSSRLLISR